MALDDVRPAGVGARHLLAWIAGSILTLFAAYLWVVMGL
jgi:hypothetical protein